MMLSMMFGMVIMARSSAERIVDAEALMLPEGYDTMLTGDHESLIKERGMYYQLYTGGLELE